MLHFAKIIVSALAAFSTLSSVAAKSSGGSSDVKTILNAMGVDQIRGVNLGGWLLLEKWITDGTPNNPFQNDENAPDEWSLHQSLGKSKTTAALNKHYSSFVTEKDIQTLAKAGINLVRIPIGHWILPQYVNSNEPWAPNDGWKYLLQAIGWAQKHGIYVLVDLHGAPGSQAYQQTTGHQSSNQFWNGGMGGNNMQRSMKLLTHLADTFSKAPYKGTVVGLELLNEPAVGQDYENYLKQGYQAIRAAEKKNGVTCKSSSGKRDIIAPATAYHEHSKRHCTKSKGHGHGHGKGHKHTHHKATKSSKSGQTASAGTGKTMTSSSGSKKGSSGSSSSSSSNSTSVSASGKAGKYNDCMWIATMYKDGFMSNSQYPRIVNDIHQYQVFTNQDNSMSAQQHISASCNLASQTSGSQNPALIGEWSGAANVNLQGSAQDTFQKKYYSAQLNAYENGGLGWIMWNFKHPSIAQWSFIDSYNKGWIEMDPSKRQKTC